MKIRTDFVTNSSSSSFIVLFKNEKDMQANKEYMSKYYSQEVIQDVFNQIKNHKISIRAARDFYAEKLKWIAHYSICYENPNYSDKPYEWQDSAEYQELEADFIDCELSIFDMYAKECDICAIVEYGDEVDGTMEHCIMPNLPFVVATISNH